MSLARTVDECSRPSPSRRVRAVMATSKPARAAAMATALPMPRLAPVTNATGAPSPPDRAPRRRALARRRRLLPALHPSHPRRDPSSPFRPASRAGSGLSMLLDRHPSHGTFTRMSRPLPQLTPGDRVLLDRREGRRPPLPPLCPLRCAPAPARTDLPRLRVFGPGSGRGGGDRRGGRLHRQPPSVVPGLSAALRRGDRGHRRGSPHPPHHQHRRRGSLGRRGGPAGRGALRAGRGRLAAGLRRHRPCRRRPSARGGADRATRAADGPCGEVRGQGRHHRHRHVARWGGASASIPSPSRSTHAGGRWRTPG